MKKYFEIGLIILFLGANCVAGVHIGIIDAVKPAVKELRKKSDNASLEWVDEFYYKTDGLDFECGNSSTTFTYKIKYKNWLNKPPKDGSVLLHIFKGEFEINGSPFVMDYLSGEFKRGAVYKKSITLNAGNDYSYYFEAKYVKDDGTQVNLTTSKMPGPKVTDGTGNDGCWQIHWIDNMSYETSLQFDKNGKPNIFYVGNDEIIQKDLEYGATYYYVTDKIKLATLMDEKNWNISDIDTNIYTEINDSDHYLPPPFLISSLHSNVDLNEDIRVIYLGMKTRTELKLIYLKETEGAWAKSELASGALSGVDICTDSLSYPHISYYKSGQGINYLKWNGSSWISEIISDIADGMISIYCDSSNNPHLAYVGNKNLKHLYKDQGNWTIENILGINSGYFVSLLLDVNNIPNIVYNASSLNYVKKSGNTWIINNIDEREVSFLSAKLDSNNLPVISYYIPEDNSLYFASYKNGSWVKENIDRGGKYNSLAVTPSGNLAISYKGDDNILKCAIWIK